MSRKVEIEMTVEDAKAVRAWQRAKDNIAEFDKQGQKTSKTFGTMMSDQVRGIAATAAGFAGVGSVIGGIVTAANLLRAEYDNLIQRQEKAANIQIPLADLERQLALNVGGDQSAPLQQKLQQQQNVLKLRDQIVTETGATPQAVTSAFSGALSARGGASIEQTAAAVTAAIQVAPAPEDVDFLAAGALDLTKSGADPRSAANFLAASGAELRLTKTAQVGENVAKAVNLLKAFGNDEKESTALFGLLTQEGVDPEGRSSVTAALQLAGQVRTLAPKAGDTFAGLDQIASNPKLQKKFLDELTGEQRFKPIFERLAKDADFRTQLGGIRDRIPGFDQANQLAADQTALLGALPTAPIRAVNMGLGSFTESVLSTDQSGISAVIREQLPALEQAIGKGATSQKVASLLRNLESGFGENPVAAIDVATGQLQSESDRLRAGRPARYGRRTYRQGGDVFTLPTEEVVAPAAPATAREISIADKLDKLIEVLTTARDVTASTVSAQNAPAVQVNVNNRPARAETRMLPGSRHADLTSPPAPSRVSRVGGN